ncbi:hypothetical protein OH77DRAFT_1422815 [Trametes cingulata]|nr:hypothetical protein OH77DRAFT_1422815 [Trametes cingulata]
MLDDFDEEDPRDRDWLPPEALKRLRRRKAPGAPVEPRKAHYHGPVLEDKSARTQRRPEWKRARKGQTKLTTYNFRLLPDPVPSESEHVRSLSPSSRLSPSLPPASVSPGPSPAASESGSLSRMESVPPAASAAVPRSESQPPSPHVSSTTDRETVSLPAVNNMLLRHLVEREPLPHLQASNTGRPATGAPVSSSRKRPRRQSSPVALQDPPQCTEEDTGEVELSADISNATAESTPPSGSALLDSEAGPMDSDAEEDLDHSCMEAAGADPKPKEDIRPWDALREQIKDDLSATRKQRATLTQINQLLILRNFATLRLKGYGRLAASQEIARQWHEGEGVHFARQVRALARHYQRFEQLPVERRGGDRGHSLLSDERVQAASRHYLCSLKTGEVTPKLLRRALNEQILPSLNITLKKPLSERTARRWLVRLGWRRTRLKKGVYMDGHERPDVQQYRSEVFLPRMAQYERCMVQWIPDETGEKLVPVEPTLEPGEKKIIAIFQDESSFHAGEYKPNIWVREGEQKLMKKGRGRIIHVSDFVVEKTGRLVVRDADGTITMDARRIIYPGANGDPWWDHVQLLSQSDDAMTIFELLYPGCIGLFIFDQSSAHASLGPDALRAFDMNKTNGGKQRVQKDTVIPMNNPVVELRGKPQKMTTEAGEAKGLQQTLEERGFDVRGMRAKCSPVCPFENERCCMARLLSKQDDFRNQESLLEQKIKARGHLCMFLPKFHCELNPIEMYWGWCKYRYREVYKEKFEDAKRVARECLDACPDEVIRRFFNRSWRFMDAYRKGLTGQAAEWAVRKQKSHRRVGQRAMMSLDAILS